MGEAQATGFVRRARTLTLFSHRITERIYLLEAHHSANPIIMIRTAYIVMTPIIPCLRYLFPAAHTTYEHLPPYRDADSSRKSFPPSHAVESPYVQLVVES